jgi:sec-independent protein translocase protein TatA
MPNIGPMEVVIVLVIALIVLGPKRLPEAGKSLGKGLKEFKGSLSAATEHADPVVKAEPVAVERETTTVA